MIKVYCNDITGAYTNCNPLTAIYTYGQLVWPTGPTPAGQWYISWIPTDLSGSFTMFGTTYRMEDYSGYYSWSGSGSGVTSNAFAYQGGPRSMTYMETNVRSIYEWAFSRCYSLSSISLSRVKYIDSCAFGNCSNLAYVYAPRVISISFAAFDQCSSLRSIYFPNCEFIAHEAFYGCSSLSYISLPKLKSTGTGAFTRCTSLTEVSLPVCEYIAPDTFYKCTSLESVYLPICSNVTGFGSCTALTTISAPMATTVAGLMDCTALQSIYFPSCKSIYTCNNCTSLSDVSLPVCEIIGESAFSGCTALSSIELPMCSFLSSGAFNECTSLSLLILSSTSVVSIYYGYHTFRNTPFANCQGSILVPPYLVESYRTNIAWASLSCVIGPIHDYYYIYWTPTSLNEQFTINGVTYNMSDYRGFFETSYSVITENAFAGTGIKTLDTNATYISYSAFTSCYSLQNVKLLLCSSIGEGAFNKCSSLSVLTLCSNSVVSINSIYGTFDYTPFANCSGSIIVPEELYSSYITSPGWRSLSCIIGYIPTGYSKINYIYNDIKDSQDIQTGDMVIAPYIDISFTNELSEYNIKLTYATTRSSINTIMGLGFTAHYEDGYSAHGSTTYSGTGYIKTYFYSVLTSYQFVVGYYFNERTSNSRYRNSPGIITTDITKDKIDAGVVSVNRPSEVLYPIKNIGLNTIRIGRDMEFYEGFPYIYGLKVYGSNDSLLMNMIPLKNISTGRAGLYDLINHEFYDGHNGHYTSGYKDFKYN